MGALYYHDWANKLASTRIFWDPGPALRLPGTTFADYSMSVVYNDAEAFGYGTELEAQYLINEHWALRAGLAYTYLEWEDACAGSHRFGFLDNRRPKA